MIKANELRIGSICSLDEENYLVGRVCGITQKNILFTYGFSDGLSLGDRPTIDELHPIKLTEDWLLKFGFVTKKTMSDTFVAPYPDNYYHIIKHHGIYVFRCAGCSLQRVNYVHQLQNLYFAITGEELILKQ